MAIKITNDGRVVADWGHVGEPAEIPVLKGRKGRDKKFREALKFSHSNKAALYYLLVRVLKLTDNKVTVQTINSLCHASVTPEILLMVDLSALAKEVRGFSTQSAARVGAAIRAFKQ